MKSRIAAAIVMCLCGLIIIHCAISYQEEIVEMERQSAKDVAQINKTIDIWYSYKGYEDYLKSAIEVYNQKNNSDIVVNLSYISDIDYFNTINSSSIEGKGPDLYIMGSEYMEKAYLLGISEANKNPSMFNDDNYAGTAIDVMTYGDNIYGYPLGFDVSALFCNDDYVKNAPATFEDIKAFADSFNGDEEDAGTNAIDSDVDYSKVQGILMWDVNSLLYNYGFVGDNIHIGASGGKAIVDINNEKVLGSAKEYLLLKDYFSLTGEDTYSNIVNDFAAGKIVFMLADSKAISTLSNSDISYSIWDMPNLTEEYTCSPLSYTDILMINPYTDSRQMAVSFAEFISNEYAGDMYEISGILSTKKDIEYEDKHLNKLIDVYENSLTMPKLMDTEDYWLTMQNSLKAIWNGANIEETFNKLQTEYIENIN